MAALEHAFRLRAVRSSPRPLRPSQHGTVGSSRRNIDVVTKREELEKESSMAADDGGARKTE